VFTYTDNPASESKIVVLLTGNYETANIASEIKRQVGDEANNYMALERNKGAVQPIYRCYKSEAAARAKMGGA